MLGIFCWVYIWVLQVCVPVAMMPKYQNSPIAPIGVNPPTEELQEQMLQETNQSEENNPVGVSDDTAETVTVVSFHLLVLMTPNWSFWRTI